MNGDVLALSGAERERLDVSRRLMRGELRQARAAELLGIGVRQVKRLVRGYRREGEASVVSRRRGRPSNNRLDEADVAATEAALRRRYADFGATLASEKLGELEGVSASKETVRQIQIRPGLWRPKRRLAKKSSPMVSSNAGAKGSRSPRDRPRTLIGLVRLQGRSRGSPCRAGKNARSPRRSSSAPAPPATPSRRPAGRRPAWRQGHVSPPSRRDLARAPQRPRQGGTASMRAPTAAPPTAATAPRGRRGTKSRSACLARAGS